MEAIRMPEPIPDSESQSDALQRVLGAAAPRAAEAQQSVAAAEEEVRKYAQLDLVIRLALMILEHTAVAAIGYTTERGYAEADPDQPVYELHGTVTMNPDAPEDHQQELDAEWELDNLLAGAGFALAARVFDVNPGEPATLHRDRLEQRARAISSEWQDATRTA
jgi:hypothetical protein